MNLAPCPACARTTARGRPAALVATALGGLLMTGCAQDSARREIFPHVWFDKGTRAVEIEGEVPIDCHNPRTARVYLEVTVCTRNSKEHEALVVTDARPSHVHAALLLAGLVPGKPGSWRMEGEQLIRIPPEGARLSVAISCSVEGRGPITTPAQEWVVNAREKKRLSEGPGAWVFAGSRMVEYQGRDFYDADGTGTLVGLTTFGSETVAFTEIFSPDSQVEEPEWIADPSVVPRQGTRVLVRITPAR